MTEAAERDGGAPHRPLILTDDFGGGTGNHVLGMVERWDPDRWTTELVSFAERTARREPPVPHTRLPPPGGPSVYPVRQILRCRQVARLVADRSPDLLHAYFFWPILYGRWLRATGRVSSLVENREDEGFAWGRHEYAWLRLTRRVPDRVICVSEGVRRVAVEREGLPEERTTVIHNGVETPRDVAVDEVGALRSELGLPEDAPVVGMVANLNRGVKGVDRFVDAVPAILERVPGARFVVVGGGSDEDAFRAHVASEGLSDQVLFPGYREDVDVFYALMDVSVLTSATEGLSITLLESMSHGVPVVATRVGGNPEVVVEGETGHLVPPGDREAFVRRVVELLRRPAVRRRMGEAARERVRSEFHVDRTAASYTDLYTELLEARRTGRE